METNSINSFLVLITGDIDNFMYTYILVALLVFTGIYSKPHAQVYRV